MSAHTGAGHGKKVCQFGVTHSRCRCTDQTVIPIQCDRPQDHGPAYEGKHRAPEEVSA